MKMEEETIDYTILTLPPQLTYLHVHSVAANIHSFALHLIKLVYSKVYHSV